MAIATARQRASHGVVCHYRRLGPRRDHPGNGAQFSKLGFITAQKDAAGNVVFAEDQRAPSDLIV